MGKNVQGREVERIDKGKISDLLLIVLSPCLLLKTHWRRRPEERDLWLSHPMGFE
jgi:hypothetical protein